MTLRALSVLLAGTLAFSSARAQTPEPGSDLTVYLVTASVGDAIFERFGHNAIWIYDSTHNTNVAYNWGMFDFDQPAFIRRFLMGRMLYSMGPQSMDDMMRQYQARNRTVWVQELNLSPARKANLREYLEWNARPENRDYRYDYYRDNCSTRARDALDRVLSGTMRRTLEQSPSYSTYRSETKRLMAGDPLMLTGMNLAMGSRIDQPLTAWDESFIPMELRTWLRELTVEGPTGERLSLVKSERTLFQATRAEPPPAAPNYLPKSLIAGLVFAGLLILFGSLRAHWSRITFGVLAGAWSLAIGLLGTLIAALWAFTDHAVTYANENVLQANLLSLVLLVGLVGLAFRKQWAPKLTARVALIVAGLGLLGLVLQLLPGLDQANGDIIALILPAHVAIATVFVRRQREHPPKAVASRSVQKARAAA
jgi:uncharacterized protein DUF4105